MKPLSASFALAFVLTLSAGPRAEAHCEVPCGIYDDPARFAAMLEDAATIGRAVDQIHALAGKQDAQSLNQIVRWVTTKEQHATRTMETIGQYFMAQRIKPPAADESPDRYLRLLTSAHDVMRAAMTCKQTADAGNVAALASAVKAFQKAYEDKAEVKAGGGSEAPTRDHDHGHDHRGHDHDHPHR